MMTKKIEPQEAACDVPHLDDSHKQLVRTTKEAVEKLCDRNSPDYDEEFHGWLRNRRDKRGRKGMTYAQLEAFGITYWAYTKFEGMTPNEALDRLSAFYGYHEVEKILTQANKLDAVKRLYDAKLSNPR